MNAPLSTRLLAAGLGDALPIVTQADGLLLMQMNVMKMLPAAESLFSARDRGLLRPGQPVIESSSGSMAYGLARGCAVLGHPLTLVAEQGAVEPWLQSALLSLGASVELVDTRAQPLRVQQLRLERLHELRKESGAWWSRQYDNPANPAGYAAAAEQLVRQAGVPDALVCPVGSGGNSAGLSAALRSIDPAVRLIGVDVHGSVSFGLPVGPREFGGIGNSLRPRCVRHSAFDEVHWVNLDLAAAGVREAAARGHGDLGLTAGCAYAVARWWRRQHPGARVAVVLPDRSFRCVERLATVPKQPLAAFAPRTVACLSAVQDRDWTRLLWGRKPLHHWHRRAARMAPEPKRSLVPFRD